VPTITILVDLFPRPLKPKYGALVKYFVPRPDALDDFDFRTF